MISIIVPVYNVEDYLVECLESLLAQTGVELEIILVDDGSTDGSLAICQAYADRYRNIKLISQTNQGQSVARNIGLEQAEGEYIFFIDSDDYLTEPGALAHALTTLETEQADIVIFSYRLIYPRKSVDRIFKHEVIDGKTALVYQLTNRISGMIGGRLFRKVIVTNSYFPIGKIGEDNFFNYLAIENSRRVVILSEIYYAYRRWVGSTTYRMGFRQFEIFEVKRDVYNQAIAREPDFAKFEIIYLVPTIIILKNSVQATKKVSEELRTAVDQQFYTYFPKLLFDPYVRLKTKINAILTAVNLSNTVRKLLRK